ncbi:MAG: SpaA isopeptide-forming pilin-related protein [Acutalibacteraceae bacterium]|nr:SpaA isopeptide-forming pilin-related protein [Acutalibacteraceae bacterium]
MLLQGYDLTNTAFLNYTKNTSGKGTAVYDYSTKITKKSVVNENGIIDYTVEFNNSVPGTADNEGYLNYYVDNVLFNDTFDDKLEYVPNSLVVTGYSPWQKDLWLCTYRYTGTVTGNTIQAPAEDFVFVDYNEVADNNRWNRISTAATFKDYYKKLNAGGKLVFTYQLKVKDEHLYTTDYSKFYLGNTAELTWGDDGSSGPATETSEFYTGLLHKHVKQDGAKLDFQVHINRKALDILEGVDTLIVRDAMTRNLSVYWDSIKLKYENASGKWIDFNSKDSKYTYTLTYDRATNTMTFVVPDSLHIIIDYTTLITENGLVEVENSVEVGGKVEVADLISAHFLVDEHSGGASGSNNKVTLLKQDGLTNASLPNATFLLYGPMGDASAVRPPGATPNIITDDGTLLRFIGTYKTGADGTAVIETQYLTPGGPYALVEYVAPEGYELLEKPVYFCYYSPDPTGTMQTVTTLVVVENYAVSFIMPETGGRGIYKMAIIGFALMAFPVLYSLIRRKRERRLMHRSPEVSGKKACDG